MLASKEPAMSTVLLDETPIPGAMPHSEIPQAVLVNGKPFQWTPEGGLDLSAAGEIIFFVRKLAMTYLPRVRGQALTLDDLIQEGMIGAMVAARRFDPGRGAKYLTYADWWIRKYLQDALREDVVSLSVRDARAGVPAFVRLDAPVGGHGDGYAFVESRGELAQPEAATTLAEVTSSLKALQEALEGLAPMARDILRRRFGLDGVGPEILESIGQSYGLSRERIRQREGAALLQLRRHMQRRGLKAEHLRAAS